MLSRATTLLAILGFWIIPSTTRVRNSPIKWGAKRAAEKYPNLATSGYKPRVLEKHKFFSFLSKHYHFRKIPYLPSMNTPWWLVGGRSQQGKPSSPPQGLWEEPTFEIVHYHSEFCWLQLKVSRHDSSFSSHGKILSYLDPLTVTSRVGELPGLLISNRVLPYLTLLLH